MKWRLFLSALVVVGWFIASAIYNVGQGPIQGSIAIGQLNGGNAEYTAARAASTTNMIPTMINIVTVLMLAMLWVPFLVRTVRTRPLKTPQGGDTMNRMLGIMLITLLAFSLVACGPAKLEKIEEIGPSETSYLIQLEGDSLSGQDVFRSVDFLEKHKVPVKRVSLPQRMRSTGRMWYDYEWIPTAVLLKVNRQPVTREWTKTAETGTSPKDQAIHVESKDSIGFAVGVNTMGSISEEQASLFLYNFSGKSLADVMDSNVRGYMQTVLSREFGTRSLSDGREEKKEIFETAFKETRDFFEKKGLTIEYMGSSEGLTYDNEKIQASIDAVFTAERDVEQAKQEKLAQEERNMLLVAKAEAERKAAQEFAMAQSAGVAKTQLEIDMKRADAQLEAAKRWDGKLPANIMPAGSGMLFGLDNPNKN